MKKIIAVICILVIAATSALACFAESSESGEEIPKADVKALTVLGDSISTGYGLEGYDSEGDNADIESYGNLVASYYGLTLGESYFNYAKNGATSADLLKKLENELSEEERASIAKSDVIIVTIGGNDLLGMLYPYMTEFLELGENASFEAITVKLLSMDEDSLKNFDKKADAFYKSKEKEMSEAYKQTGKNITAISAELKAISPKAQIYIQSVYNPSNELPQYKSLEILNDHILSKMINSLNIEIFSSAKEAGMYTVDIFSEFTGRKEACTNIADLDIHPNKYGHSLIADALEHKIDNVYDNLNNKDEDDFSKGENTWLWFVVAAAVTVAAIPVVIFFVKKSSAS